MRFVVLALSNSIANPDVDVGLWLAGLVSGKGGEGWGRGVWRGRESGQGRGGVAKKKKTARGETQLTFLVVELWFFGSWMPLFPGCKPRNGTVGKAGNEIVFFGGGGFRM